MYSFINRTVYTRAQIPEWYKSRCPPVADTSRVMIVSSHGTLCAVGMGDFVLHCLHTHAGERTTALRCARVSS